MTLQTFFGKPFSLRMTIVVTFLFGLVNALVRRLAGDRLSMDDAKTNVFTQVWQWGYQPDNPPLFEWLTKLLHLVTTGDFWSFLILKYIALMLAAGFVYGAVRIYAKQREAFGTAVGLVLLYQVGWNFHQAFTHSALLLPAVAAMIWAGLRAFRMPSAGRIAVLGLALGVAMMTKYNAALFVLGFLAAGLANPRSRATILSAKFLLVPLIAGGILLPHALWFLGQSDAYRETLEGTMGLSGSYGARVGAGLLSLLVATLSFFVPWAFVAAPLARGKGLVWHAEERLLIRASMMALGFLVIAVLGVGVGNVSERYLIPVLLPAYIGLTSVVLRGLPSLKVWWWACGVLAVLVVILRIVTYLFPGPPLCSDCREFVPYEGLEAPLSQMAPEGSILLVREENTGGNLVSMFPNSPVRVLTSFRLMNPVRDEGRACYYVWSEDMVGGAPLEKVFTFAYEDSETVMVEVPWTHPLRKDGFRHTVWGITPITRPDLYAYFCTAPAD